MAQVMAEACNLDTQNILVCDVQARLPLPQRADQFTSQVAHPENNRQVCHQPDDDDELMLNVLRCHLTY